MYIFTKQSKNSLTWFEFNVIGDLWWSNVQLNGVIGFDDWIWITDGTTVVCYQEWNVFSTQLCFLHLAQLVLKILRWQIKRLVIFVGMESNRKWFSTEIGIVYDIYFSFFSWNTVNGETSLNIIDQTEMFAGFFDGNNIWKNPKLNWIFYSKVAFIPIEYTAKRICVYVLTHETSWEVGVGAHFAIDFDQTLHDNLGYFRICLRKMEWRKLQLISHQKFNLKKKMVLFFPYCLLLVNRNKRKIKIYHMWCDNNTYQCILQSVTKEDDKWQWFAQLVWTGRWTWCKYTTQFVQHPCFWSI